MAEPTYAQDTWSGLDHFVCLAPVGSAIHGWDCWDLERMTAHLAETHGLTAEPEEEP
jgi:hypothetical protein